MVLMKYGIDDLVKRLNFPGMGVIKKIHHADLGNGYYELGFDSHGRPGPDLCQV